MYNILKSFQDICRKIVKDNFDIADFLKENLTFTIAEQLYIDKDIKYDIYDLKRIDSNVIYQLDNEGFVLMSK